ncbi:MAG: hypothetical protein P4M11_14545 [Candidatus Pacebacteria bacterium]|nr:hypothetical protein [Candidatus Paceibacterota bacterium]
MSIFADNSTAAIPLSFYHYSNFEHLKDIPIYRITTPKIAYKEIGCRELPPSNPLSLITPPRPAHNRLGRILRATPYSS